MYLLGKGLSVPKETLGLFRKGLVWGRIAEGLLLFTYNASIFYYLVFLLSFSLLIY